MTRRLARWRGRSSTVDSPNGVPGPWPPAKVLDCAPPYPRQPTTPPSFHGPDPPSAPGEAPLPASDPASPISRLSIDASALANPFRTGIGRALESLLPELVALAAGRTCIRLFAGGRILSAPARQLIQEGRIEAETFPCPSLYAWQQLGMGFALRRFSPSVHLAPEALLPLGMAVPSVGIVHDLLWLRHPETCKTHVRLIYRWRFLPSLQAASVLLCDSRFTRDELEAAYPGRLAVTPSVSHLGVSRRSFHPDDVARVNRTLARYKLPPPYLLAVGNLRPHKNLPLVVEALRRLHRSGEPIPRFVVAGAGSASDRACLEAPDLPPGTVSILGYVDESDLADLYRGALALVFPSRYEGFGLPVLEAMAAGTPVLHARAGALPEVAGGAGCDFDPDDAEDLARLLHRLQTDPGLAARLRQLGVERAEAFTWRATANTVWNALQTAARTRS